MVRVLGKKRIDITLDEEVIEGLDRIRGLVARSAYINDLLKKEIAEKEVE